MTGELFKLSRGEVLSDEEKNNVRLFENQLVNFNSFVNGLQNGSSTINAMEVNSNNYTRGRNYPGGSVAMVWFRESVPTGGSYTDIGIERVFINELFSVSGDVLTFNKSGLYSFNFEIQSASITSGLAYVAYQGLSMEIEFRCLGTDKRYRSVRKGDTVYLKGKHSEAGTQDFYIFMFFELIREYEASVTT